MYVFQKFLQYILITFLYSIKRFLFKTDTNCVLCAVRTESFMYETEEVLDKLTHSSL